MIYQEKVSVQIAAYRPEHIEETILSVINQNCEEWELVILIDGPPEKNLKRINEVIKKYINNKKIKVYFQENRGSGATRKKLYKITNCKYVLPIDDDDMLCSNAVSEVLKCFKENPNASIVKAGHKSIKEWEKINLPIILSNHFQPIMRKRVHGMTTNLTYVDQLWCFNKELYDKVEEVKLSEEAKYVGVEIELFLKMEELGPIVWIPKMLYIKREWPDQITERPDFPVNLTKYCIRVGQEAAKRRGLDVRLIWDVGFRVYENKGRREEKK